jgi:4-hydroxy-tetrahydrodipicolinate reductase
MKDRIGVIQFGIGPIGQAILRDLVKKGALQIVGAADVDEEKVGRDLADLVGLDTPLGVTVSSNSAEVLSNAKARLAILSTVSSLVACYPQIEEIVEAGKYLISTCEELAYPWLTHPELSRQIDDRAKRNGVAVLGTGVNPGFAMDYLPIVVSGMCSHVERIKVFRIQDASYRRLPFQRKIGAGLKLAEFEKKRHEKQIRHVGLTESIHMIARGLGWDLDKTVDEIFPVLAEKPVETPSIKIQSGDVKGMRQVGRGLKNDKEVITLEMVMSLGQENPRDVIHIEGTPDVKLVFEGGIHGDIATASVVVNAIPRLLELPPGLKTMLDIPPVHCYGGTP